jgi:hypothetical protein
MQKHFAECLCFEVRAASIFRVESSFLWIHSFPQPKDTIFFLQSSRPKHSSSLRFPLCMLSLIPSFHVLTGLPRLLFLCGSHSATCLAIFQSSIRMTWIYHLNYCSSISCNISFFSPIFVLIVSFLILSVVVIVINVLMFNLVLLNRRKWP